MVVPSFLCCEPVCSLWPRKSLLVQLSWLDRDVPARSQRRCKKGTQGWEQNRQMRDIEISYGESEEGER